MQAKTHPLVEVEVEVELGVVTLNNNTRRALDSLGANASLRKERGIKRKIKRKRGR